MKRPLPFSAIVACIAAPAFAQSFVNFETPHVHPLDMTPDRARLLAVNTADNRLEVFDISSPALPPVKLAAIPVGLEPVSVRARTNTEAWVVNNLSDTVSIVNLTTMNVVNTFRVGDEPGDVVFAGAPQRAFVSISQENAVRVYDPLNPAAAPQTIAIAGEEPRALATDGTRVFAAVFESGNNTTIIPFAAVSTTANPYPGDPNPPPNSGSSFNPPQRAGNPVPPRNSLIVKKNAAGQWRDDNTGNWSPLVAWNLLDNDLAIINASTLGVTYARGLMNANMALALGPAGRVTVVGTDGINHVRFEPIIRGVFNRVILASVDPAAPATPTVLDLNPHLSYTSATIPQAQRDESLGDPRGIAWNAAGTVGYVSGMGSNSIIRIDAAGARLGRIDTARGPTGLALNEPAARLYALNRFDASISVIDTAANTELSRVSFYDPTPQFIRAGRVFLYDTRLTSGLGQASCASCHIDARLDTLSWDLGDPSGLVKIFNQVCNGGAGGCENWHPMKGPMATQTLQGIIGTEPLHWRGDREDLPAFNPAFHDLLADDAILLPSEIQQLTDYIQSLKFAPNPFRTITNTVPSAVFTNGGNPATGQNLFNTALIDGGAITCVSCHALPAGTSPNIISGPLLQEPQSMKVPQLRNMYRKSGFSTASANNTRGFGFIHDGSTDNLFNFLGSPVFRFAAGAAGLQQRRDIEAFMFHFDTGTHAAVGMQVTLTTSTGTPAQQTTLDTLQTLAMQSQIGLIVKGRFAGISRGWYYLGGSNYQSDRTTEITPAAALRAAGGAGAELTFTAVPFGTHTRIGVDRDEDGYFDRDELDAGSDPADPLSIPQPPACPGDADGDNMVGLSDIAVIINFWGQSVPPGTNGDLNNDGTVGLADVSVVTTNWGTVCP